MAATQELGEYEKSVFDVECARQGQVEFRIAPGTVKPDLGSGCTSVDGTCEDERMPVDLALEVSRDYCDVSTAAIRELLAKLGIDIDRSRG